MKEATNKVALLQNQYRLDNKNKCDTLKKIIDKAITEFNISKDFINHNTALAHITQQSLAL